MRAGLRSRLRTSRGYLIVAAGAAGGRMAAFLLTVILARAFGPAEFGEFFLFFAIFASFVAATDFVDGTYVLQATRPTEFGSTRLLRGALVLKSGLVMLVALLAYPLAVLCADVLFHEEDLRAALVVAIVSGVLLGFVSLRASTFLARQCYGAFSVVTSVFYVVIVIALLPSLFIDLDLTTSFVYVVIFAVSVAVSTASVASLLREAWPLRLDFPVLKRMLLFGKWFIAAQVVVLIFLRIDLYLLARYRSDVDVGQYGGALRVVAIGFLMIGALNAYFLPRAGRIRESRPALRAYVREGLVLSGSVCIALASLFAFCPVVVRVLLGAEFEPAVDLTRILLLGVACYAFSTPFLLVAAADDVPRHTFFILGVKFAVLTTAAALMIPSYGATGAAWAYLISEGTALAYASLFVWARWRSFRRSEPACEAA